MNNIIKICGKNFNSNFDIIHTRKILHYLFIAFRDTQGYDVDLMETIAGFAFAILGDFDCILAEDSSLEEDKEKTTQNIDKLCSFLYGGYRKEYKQCINKK